MTRLTEAEVLDQGCQLFPVDTRFVVYSPAGTPIKSLALDSPFVTIPAGKMLVGPANCQLMARHRLLQTSTFAQLPAMAVSGGHQLDQTDVFAIADALAANCGYKFVVASLPKGVSLGSHEPSGPHSEAAASLREGKTWGRLDASAQNNISLSELVARLLDAGHDIDAVAEFPFFYSKPFADINLPVMRWETFIPDATGGHYGWKVPVETIREVAQTLSEAVRQQVAEVVDGGISQVAVARERG